MTIKSYNTITREDLGEMFHSIDQESGWDATQDLLWGYFFTSENRMLLENLCKDLENRGYRFVTYREPDDDDILFGLHVEKEESHSVDSLHQRNEELSRVAHDCGVTYDGMDVGPIGE